MQATEQPPLYLTILRKGDTNIIDLAEVGTLIPRSETQVDATFLQDLAAEMMRLATPGYGRRDDQMMRSPLSVREPGEVVHDLQRIGGLIFSHLLTEPARERLRTAAPCDLYLRLDEQLIHLPWELCYDGKDFLATKFRVGRQVITGYPIPRTTTTRRTSNFLKVLLIADPTESLPQAGKEAEQLCLLLDEVPGIEVTLLGGKDLHKVRLLAALQAHHVVHFAGHSYYDPDDPSKSGWRLREGVLTAGELSKLSHPPFLVFSNSCQAGVTAEWTGNYRYEGQAFGIGSSFLLAGVRNYIGTFWVVHDEESLLFATAFYRAIVSGLSLGGALLQARHEAIRHKGWQGLTWASYMLYGDPTFLLVPGVDPQAQSAVSPAAKTQESPGVYPAKSSDGVPLDDKNWEEGRTWEALRRYEQEQCTHLDLLGRTASLTTHYQVLPLLREVKRERLPRTGRSHRREEELARPNEEEPEVLQDVDILRWEEGLQEESVTYEQVTLAEIFRDFPSVAKESKSAVPRFVVLGPPGSGKTTFTQYLGHQTASGDLQVSGRPLIPARVRLRDWEVWTTSEGAADPSLTAYLTQRYSTLSYAPSTAQWQRWLQQGSVLLLLDGLDEVAGKPAFLAALKTALMTNPECPILLTCRTVSFEQHRVLCPDFPLFTLAGLESHQRNSYIRTFPAEHESHYDPEQLIAHLTRAPQLGALAANPLLLSILCYVVDDAKGTGLPATRSALYRQALTKFLTHRGQRVEIRYPGEEPSSDEKLAILARTALHLFATGDRQLSFSGDELGQALRRALSEEGYGEASAPWANALRADLTQNSGILRGSAEHGFFFLHLTVQEFLAAAALARVVNERGWEAPLEIAGTTVSAQQLLDRKAWDPRWQEVVTLLAGQLRDPVPLFRLLTDEKREDAFRHRLALAALCLPEAHQTLKAHKEKLLDRITTAAISHWFRHEQDGMTAAVSHLTRTLPVLGQLNGQVEGVPLVQWLSQRLRAASRDLRVGAAAALGQLREVVAQHTELLTALVATVHDVDELVRAEALEALRRIGPAAAPYPEVWSALIQLALYDRDGLTRTAAVKALLQIGRTDTPPAAALSALETALNAESQHVRARAADLLQKLGMATPHDHQVQPVSMPAISSDTVPVVSPAAAQISRLLETANTDQSQMLTTLVQIALSDKDMLLRTEAVRALESQSDTLAQYPGVLSVLIRALHAEDRGVRLWAARICKQVSTSLAQQAEVLSALEDVALHDKDGGVRTEAVAALGRMGKANLQHPGVLLVLVRATLHDKDAGVRSRAAEALGQIGVPATRQPETLSALVTALRDKDYEVHCKAAEALGRITAQGMRVFQRRWGRRVEGKSVKELAALE